MSVSFEAAIGVPKAPAKFKFSEKTSRVTLVSQRYRYREELSVMVLYYNNK